MVSEGVNGKVKTALAVLLLAALSALYFGSAVSGELLLTERDLSVFFIPPRLLWVDARRAGEFPLWNPYFYSGPPLFATLQPGVLYPVNVLLLLLPFAVAFNWTIIVHFMLAGVFTFFLLREMGAKHGGGFPGAAGLLLSPRFLLLFLFALFPQVLLVDDSGARLRNLLFLALAGIVFLALSAVQLLPFLELAAQSTRSGGLSYTEATTWSFDLKDFIQFFIPDPYGSEAADR